MQPLSLSPFHFLICLSLVHVLVYYAEVFFLILRKTMLIGDLVALLRLVLHH
jgi:hypothetical protein